MEFMTGGFSSFLETHYDGRNVVACGPAEGYFKQVGDKILWLLVATTFIVEFGIGHLLVDAVGTQHERHAGATSGHHPVHEQLFFGAHRAGEDTGTGRRRRCRVGTELGNVVLATVDVIPGDLAQPIVLETIGPTVPDPTAQGEIPVVHEDHDGRPDQVDATRCSCLQQVEIDLDQGVLDRFDEIENTAVAGQGTETLDDHGAGVVAGRMSAKAVGNNPQADIIAHQDGIFVVGTNLSGHRSACGNVSSRHASISMIANGHRAGSTPSPAALAMCCRASSREGIARLWASISGGNCSSRCVAISSKRSSCSTTQLTWSQPGCAVAPSPGMAVGAPLNSKSSKSSSTPPLETAAACAKQGCRRPCRQCHAAAVPMRNKSARVPTTWPATTAQSSSTGSIRSSLASRRRGFKAVIHARNPCMPCGSPVATWSLAAANTPATACCRGSGRPTSAATTANPSSCCSTPTAPSASSTATAPIRISDVIAGSIGVDAVAHGSANSSGSSGSHTGADGVPTISWRVSTTPDESAADDGATMSSNTPSDCHGPAWLASRNPA